MVLDQDEILKVSGLLNEQRWAALAVQDHAKPLASMVAFVADPNAQNILLLLSELARHTQCLRRSGMASLVISETDTGIGDPQTLSRLSLTGTISVISRDHSEFSQCRDKYSQRFPDSKRLFQFGDFHLFRLTPETMRFVAGFGRAYQFTEPHMGRFWQAIERSS